MRMRSAVSCKSMHTDGSSMILPLKLIVFSRGCYGGNTEMHSKAEGMCQDKLKFSFRMVDRGKIGTPAGFLAGIYPFHSGVHVVSLVFSNCFSTVPVQSSHHC